MERKVLVIGELNVDMILNRIDGFPKIGTEILASDLHLTLGSSSAIFASNLSAQDINVSFLGMIGTDQFGKLVLETLQQNKVNTENVIQSQTHKTGVTVVMNYDMDRAMVTYPGAMNYLSLEEVKSVDLKSYQHVHISSIFLQPLIKKDILPILELCKALGLTTSLDPQWDPEEKWDLDLNSILPLIDVFLPNITEFLALTKSDSIEQGIKTLNNNFNTIAIKQGEKGAALYKNDHTIIQKEAYLNEKVVDCIGAGDSFDAGFVYGYIKGFPLASCLERGNIMGAVNTTAPGGTAAFKDFEKTKITIKEQFHYNL